MSVRQAVGLRAAAAAGSANVPLSGPVPLAVFPLGLLPVASQSARLRSRLVICKNGALMEPSELLNESLKREWTDQYVEVNPEQPELRRFGGNRRPRRHGQLQQQSSVDFQDGGWYDVSASGAVFA